MPRSTGFIVVALVVAVVGFAVWFTFGAAAPMEVQPKGGEDAVVSPALVALVSLCTAIVSLFTGIASLVLKVMEIRAKSRVP